MWSLFLTKLRFSKDGQTSLLLWCTFLRHRSAPRKVVFEFCHMQKRRSQLHVLKRGSDYRMQGNFGAPVLHVLKSFEEWSITQYALLGFKEIYIKYIKHERQCFIGISKHREETWKYDAVPSTLIRFQTKTELFCSGYCYRPHYNAENDHRKRSHSNTLSRVERFE